MKEKEFSFKDIKKERAVHRSDSTYRYVLLSQALSILWMIAHLIVDTKSGSTMLGLSIATSIITRCTVIGVNIYFLTVFSFQWREKIKYLRDQNMANDDAG